MLMDMDIKKINEKCDKIIKMLDEIIKNG